MGFSTELLAPAAAKTGLYVSEFHSTSIFGYSAKNKKNKPATCTESGVSYPNQIAVDGKGNLIDPDGGTHTVIIFQGPGMCGAKAATISDPYGQPADAASSDAVTGEVAVANIDDNNSLAGSISVCTVAKGCTSNLTNPSIYTLAAVAMSKNGDCWGDASDVSNAAHLVYFKKCAGAGTVATGFFNASSGGIDIDGAGNLVTVDVSSNKVNVYSGCNPACGRVATSALLADGGADFGRLNKKGTMYATGDYVLGQIDIYRYSAGTLSYAYSFNDGLNQSLIVEGVAYNPRSSE